jgi:amino acid adenylation domain-containing protein
MAWILAEHGVGSDAVVGLLAERSIDFLTAVIAVLKAGGAYLPLDPRYPPSRLLQVVRQSGARVVLVAERFAPIVTQAVEGSIESLVIEELSERAAPDVNPPVRSHACNLAYVIYTSGSTGIPKGAMIEHRGMVNHLFAKITDLKLTASDVVAQTAPQAFDISVWQFLIALLVGGRVTIFPDEIAFDPTRLPASVQSEGITVLEVVPSLLRAILDQIDLQGENRPALGSLRWMIPTGEALPPETCRLWFSQYPDIPMVNAYGPTECSDDVTHCFIVDPPDLDVAHMPIGRPVPNTQLYILDPDWLPVPMGIAGELYVGGAGVCRGYLSDPARTSEGFIPNPFDVTQTSVCESQVGGTRLYRTGDLARHLPDGAIEFLGRIDHQVKIRGFRIELGEIESTLLREPGVKEAVVVPFERGAGDKRLAAYIVPQSGSLDATALRSSLKDKLPNYMAPNAYVVMERLPLTPSGKIDRKALPAPESKHIASDESYVAPRTPVEKLIADIWKDVLGVERVGVHDDFFEIGGQSLLATQLAYKIQQVLPVEISLRSFFEAPTVAQLAELVAQNQDEDQQLLAEMLAEIEKLPESEPLTQ